MKQIDLQRLNKYITGEVPSHFRNEPGVEPYAYYADIGSKPVTIGDLGSLHGLSALAFSYTFKCKVLSWDIDQSQNIVKNRTNIEFIEGDVFDEQHLKKILECDILLIDLDPHDGAKEEKFLNILIDRNYKGLTLWDDINLNVGMKNFWRRVKVPKEDVSNLGHHSGTGKIIL